MSGTAGNVAAVAAQSYLGLYGQAINSAAQFGTAAVQSALGGDADSGRGRFDLSKFVDGGGFNISSGRSKASTSKEGGGRTTTEAVDGVKSRSGAAIDSQTALILAAGVVVSAAIFSRRRG